MRFRQSDNQAEELPQADGGGALVTTTDNDRHDQEQRSDQTPRYKALFDWAKGVLASTGLLEQLRDARTLEEVDGVQFDSGNLTLITAIQDALRPSDGSCKWYFQHLRDTQLRSILRNRFTDHKKERRKELIADNEQQAAADKAREKREEDVKFFGEFAQYKVCDRGVFVQTIKGLEVGEALMRWSQISRTRIELMAVTRSKQGDNWGVYVKLVNLDGRVTRLAIPRQIINDRQGKIAGRLAGLGVDVVREQRAQLPDFLLSTVEVVDNTIQELTRFLSVPTTGWYKLSTGGWVFVLPHTTKIPVDLPPGELAVFQPEQLHLQHGFGIEGTVDEWREQIAEPFAGNSIATLAVGVALSGPVTPWAGVPPGIFHIFCASKHGKSLASTIGQSVYGRPLIPNETAADPFGLSWLATANGIGRMVLVRSSIGAFLDELNQGRAKDIADAAYRIANGIDKARLGGGKLEPRPTYCVPGFSTGEEAMVDFLGRNGVRVTDGMRARFADIPAEVQPGSVFEKFGADDISGLGRKFYPLVSKLYGAVGDAWLQHLVEMGPEQIGATVKKYQEEFRSRARVKALCAAAPAYGRSVIDRFATVAAACRMAKAAGLLWRNADTDADIEACTMRWAEQQKSDTLVAAIAHVMRGKESWQGTASELLTKLNGTVAIDSAEALGRRLRRPENIQRLKWAGFQIVQYRDRTAKRSKMIRIERVRAGVDCGQLDG